MKLDFIYVFSKEKTQILNFMKIHPVGAELFYAGGRTDGQTDMMKPVVAFHDFASLRQALNTVPWEKCSNQAIHVNNSAAALDATRFKNVIFEGAVIGKGWH
jgi:hypothetical protein